MLCPLIVATTGIDAGWVGIARTARYGLATATAQEKEAGCCSNGGIKRIVCAMCADWQNDHSARLFGQCVEAKAKMAILWKPVIAKSLLSDLALNCAFFNVGRPL